MTGGFLVAAGSAGMAQYPSSTSTQYSLAMAFSSAQDAGTLFHIQDSDGADILTYAPAKRYQTMIFCSTDLVSGKTCQIYYGGSCSGSETDGLYSDGTCTPGTRYAGFTVSSIVTKVVN